MAQSRVPTLGLRRARRTELTTRGHRLMHVQMVGTRRRLERRTAMDTGIQP